MKKPELKYELHKIDGDYRIEIQMYELIFDWHSSYTFHKKIFCGDTVILNKKDSDENWSFNDINKLMFTMCDYLQIIIDKHKVGDYKVEEL